MSAVRSQYPGVAVKHGGELTKLADGSFSLFLFQVLEHLGDLDGFMRNLYRLLKMDGLAFASVPHPVELFRRIKRAYTRYATKPPLAL